jgi:RNA polymerase sigma-70 factor (ECF subfamily)
MAELEQMSIPEICAVTGEKVNTVYSRLRLAREDFERSVARRRARDAWRLR